MTYPGSRQHSWVAGERVDHDVLNAWVSDNAPWGNVAAPASATSAQTGITTVTDLTSLSITFTAAANRRYLLVGNVPATSTVANDRVEVVIADGSNNVLQVAADNVGVSTGLTTLVPMVDVVPGAGSVTYKLRIQRGSGTGTVGSNPLGGWSARFHVVDMGPTTP